MSAAGSASGGTPWGPPRSNPLRATCPGSWAGPAPERARKSTHARGTPWLQNHKRNQFEANNLARCLRAGVNMYLYTGKPLVNTVSRPMEIFCK